MSLLPSRELLKRVRSGERILSDGAIGSTLIQAGIAPEGMVNANRSHPDLVRKVHGDAIAAGAEVITSNTFGAPGALEWEAGFRAGIAIADRIARQADREIAILLSVYPDELLQAPDTVCAAFCESEDQEYLLLIETATDIIAAVNAVAAARQRGVSLIAVTCHFQADFKMPDGTSPSEAADALQQAGASVIGANCGVGPDAMLSVARQMCAVSELPTLFQPNEGLPTKQGNGWVYPVNIDRFAALAASLFDVGASIVGGCCGTTPAHIAAIDRLLFHPQRRE